MRSGNKNILGNLQAPKINQLMDNSLLNAFDIAVNGSLTRHGMVDGIRDAFVDESGIDTGSSINEDYNSAGDYYVNATESGGIDVNTKLMIHANGGDESGQAHAPTYKYTAQIDATIYKFGAGSLFLDGNSDYLTVADSADWDFGTGAFTLDTWVRFASLPTGRNDIINHGLELSNSQGEWGFQISPDSGSYRFALSIRQASSWFHYYSGNFSLSTNTWYHFAMVRDGSSNLYAFKDGIQAGSTGTSSDTMTNGSSILLTIGAGGADAPAGTYLNGHMDGVRITKGEALWTTNFTKPSTVPTAGANTKLLLNFEGGDQYAGHNVEPQGTAQIDLSTKKWGTGAWKFDGDSDYLELSDSADWDLVGSNSDDWTIDLWVKHDDHAGSEHYIAQYEDGSNYWRLSHTSGTGLSFHVESGGGTLFTTTVGGEITDTDWHHIALCKVADEYGIYKDGVQVAYVQSSSTDTFTGILAVGSLSVSNYFDGNMDEIRIQHSNIFSASPNNTPDDTITVPTEEYSDTGEILDMTLISNSVTASSDPDNARLVLFEEDVDAITLNTDLKAYVSKDGGSTWAQVTLTDEGDYDTNQRILAGSVDLTQSGIGSGTSIEYKITTHNAKELKIHGVGSLWD